MTTDAIVAPTDAAPLDTLDEDEGFHPTAHPVTNRGSRGDCVATPSVRQRREARIAQNRAVLPQKPGTARALLPQRERP